MNFARVIELDGAPTLVVYKKTHGTHQHTDIPIAGQNIRFENEGMPKPEDAEHWLTMKLQEEFDCVVRTHRYDNTAVFIDSFRALGSVAA